MMETKPWVIEESVPVPSSKRARKYPFLEMAVGNSVFFAGEEINGRAYRAAMSTGTRHNQEYVARKADGGIRIWRKS